MMLNWRVCCCVDAGVGRCCWWLPADEQNNKIIVLSSRGGASVISTSGGNAIQCAGLHHMHTAPGHISHSFRNFINKCEIYVDGYIYSQFWAMNV